MEYGSGLLLSIDSGRLAVTWPRLAVIWLPRSSGHSPRHHHDTIEHAASRLNWMTYDSNNLSQTSLVTEVWPKMARPRRLVAKIITSVIFYLVSVQFFGTLKSKTLQDFVLKLRLKNVAFFSKTLQCRFASKKCVPEPS